MIQIATNSSQSARLKACGLNPSTADMTLSDGYDLSAICYHHGVFSDKDEPAWSLSVLLAFLPNSVQIGDSSYEFQLCKCPFGYEVKYHTEGLSDPFGCLCKEPIEGCVSAIEWLKKIGCKLKEI
ncbi:hypothetical protein [uncultured Duncaniella sp.]|jgi:hypothetical protein|uniref:hypothetical protein n=1 Tax=uncultured Duncaniella sp. TaxID=2768039 RepID=UPI0025B20101|nr:hypothetical protein [uncultured Duncaniella sp.]